MLSVKEMSDLRKLLRDAIKSVIWQYAKVNKTAYIHIYDGTVNSVRFAIVDSDGKHETCYDVTIRKLGKRRVF